MEKSTNNIGGLFKEELPKTTNDKNYYYYQISHINFSSIVSKALILPIKYEKDWIEDIQSKYPDYIFISNEVFDYELKDGFDIIVKLLFNDEEKKQFSDNNIFYHKPLPITRIEKIYVESSEIKEKILKSLDAESAGIFPKYRIEVKTFKNKKNYDQILIEIPKSKVSKHDTNILKYNKILGLLANVKIVDYLYFNKTAYYSNLSNKFLDYISVFNSKLKTKTEKKTIDKLKTLIDNNPTDTVLRKFYDFLYTEDEFTFEVMKDLFSVMEDVDKSTFDLIDEMKKPRKRKKIIQELIQSKTKVLIPIIAFLYMNGSKTTNDKDSYKNLLSEIIDYDSAPSTIAIMGLYFGYRSIRPYFEIEIKNKQLSELPNKFQHTFSLESKLDYVIIESVYQYIFNGTVSNSYFEDYLNLPENHKTTIPKINIPKTEYIYKKQTIVDKTQYSFSIVPSKKNELEKLLDKLKQYPERITPEYCLYSLVYGDIQPNSAIIKVGVNSSDFFQKEELEKNITKKGKITEKLINAIEYDIKYNLSK